MLLVLLESSQWAGFNEGDLEKKKKERKKEKKKEDLRCGRYWILSIFLSFKNSIKIWILSTFFVIKNSIKLLPQKMVLKGKISWVTKPHFRLMGQAPLVCVMLWWITVAVVVVLLVGLAFKGLSLAQPGTPESTRSYGI
jgi:hypothetical protein